MGKLLLFLCVIFLVNILATISASCANGQIDINSATIEELDKLSGIGPVKAQAIIDTRPFESLDNLIDVIGIGEVILANIKQQGLACVEGEESAQEEEEITQEEEKNIQQEEKTQNSDEKSAKEDATKEDVSSDKEETTKIASIIQKTEKITGEEVKTIMLSPLSLSPKDIKSEGNKEQLNKNKFSIYGLITFCILLIVLFGFKKIKNEKTEFK
jgi:competence ComEA-like helix-hairpin-helix protein